MQKKEHWNDDNDQTFPNLHKIRCNIYSSDLSVIHADLFEITMYSTGNSSD